jgi:hypothetical protein
MGRTTRVLDAGWRWIEDDPDLGGPHRRWGHTGVRGTGMRGISLVRATGMLALLGCLLGGCAMAPAPSSGPPGSAVAAQGRSRCLGSVPVVRGKLKGAAADTLEQLQGTYEEKPGFRAVVFDGAQAIVVVDGASLPAWIAELTPKGIAVAPSCVDPLLLDAVMAAVPALTPPVGGSTAGYNALDDAIEVGGIGADALLAALDEVNPALGETARGAVGAGTLRINEARISVSR